jgi:uncharacterized protein (DUF433 family)
MAAELTFKYDREADILHIDKCLPYAEQESQELGDDLVARLNPSAAEIENLEVMFFSTRLLRSNLFQLPVAAGLRLAVQPLAPRGIRRPRCGIHGSIVYNGDRRISAMTLIAPRITVDPHIRFGKPMIEGTRVPVSTVVGAVAAGDPWAEIAREYGITEEDIRAALAYAANRLEEETVRAPI